MNTRSAQLAYRPIGLVTGLAAGSIAGAVFRQIWKRLGHEEDAPDAMQSEHPLGSVLLAACIQGAIFAVVKALIDRAGAKGFEKLTGSWPAA